MMINKKFLLLSLFGLLLSSAAAQSVVRILSFEKNDGIIDRGSEGGIRVGDVFEVNRYDGDFVYWVGRVEVVVVRARFAGVKLLAKAPDATLQKDDVLELQKREIDPMLDKLKQSTSASAASNGVAKDSGQSAFRMVKSEKAENFDGIMAAPLREQRILFGVTGGLMLPVFSSRLAGSSFWVNVQNMSSGTQRVVNLSEAYGASAALQVFFVLPLTKRWSLNLNYAYAPLNVKGSKEAELLSNGLRASASSALITATVHWLWSNDIEIGLGSGLYLPQATLQSSRQTMTISNRHFGFALSGAHQLALGTNLWLRSQLSYNIFLDKGPAIHFLALQVGPCFGIGR